MQRLHVRWQDLSVGPRICMWVCRICVWLQASVCGSQLLSLRGGSCVGVTGSAFRSQGLHVGLQTLLLCSAIYMWIRWTCTWCVRRCSSGAWYPEMWVAGSACGCACRSGSAAVTPASGRSRCLHLGRMICMGVTGSACGCACCCSSLPLPPAMGLYLSACVHHVNASLVTAIRGMGSAGSCMLAGWHR